MMMALPIADSSCYRSRTGFSRRTFIDQWTRVSEAVGDNSHAHGFHDTRHTHSKDPAVAMLSHSTALILIVGEIAEAHEALRHDNPPSDKIPEFSNWEEELADAVIRIMDLGFTTGARVGEAIVAKMDYNEGRPMLHGGKKV